ncbi:hypothetical protein BH09MYX1_BH09MYX1_27650 [soil metagenome]
MNRMPLFAFLALVNAACSGSDSSPAATDAASDAIETKDTGAIQDGTTPPADGAVVDASTDAAAVDGGATVAKPPLGYKRCGHGTANQTNAAAACAFQGSSFLEQNLPPRSCDGATITSASWEVWCGGGPIYVWFHFVGLSATGKYKGCFDMDEIGLSWAWLETTSAASGATPTPSNGKFSTTVTLDATLQTLGNTTSEATGTGNLFVNGSFPAPCNAQAPMGVMSGVAIAWDAVNGN